MTPTHDAFDFWRKWLITSCALTGAFGAMLMLAPVLTKTLFSLILFGDQHVLQGWGELPAKYLTLLHGVLGAVIFGWSAALFALLQGTFQTRSRSAWTTFVVCLLAWFVPDTAFSLVIGFWQNALFNCAFLALFAPGVWGTRPQPRKHE